MSEFWSSIQGVIQDETFWTAAGAVFTAVAAAAIVLAARQLKFDAWLKAQELFTKDDFRDARRIVMEECKGKDLNTWSSDQRQKGLLVCRRMDEFVRLSPFLGRTFLLKSRMLDVWYDPIGKCWSVLEPLVREEQTKWPEKWNAFAHLGKRAQDRIEKRHNKALQATSEPVLSTGSEAPEG